MNLPGSFWKPGWVVAKMISPNQQSDFLHQVLLTLTSDGNIIACINTFKHRMTTPKPNFITCCYKKTDHVHISKTCRHPWGCFKKKMDQNGSSSPAVFPWHRHSIEGWLHSNTKGAWHQIQRCPLLIGCDSRAPGLEPLEPSLMMGLVEGNPVNHQANWTLKLFEGFWLRIFPRNVEACLIWA